MMKTFTGRLFSALLFTLASATFFSGCSSMQMWFGGGGGPMYEWNPRWSVNVAYVNSDWPNEIQRKLLNKTEEYLLESYGPPELVHFWWSRREPVIDFYQYHRYKSARRGKIDPQRISWIYPELEKEIVVSSKGGEMDPIQFEEMPLSEKLKVICEYGDPQEIKYGSEEGERVEKWIYFNAGTYFRFLDDELLEKNTHSIPVLKGYKSF